MDEPHCDSIRKKYEILRKRAEECSRLLVTVGVLSETFINAFGVFEETKDELRELIGERKKYFSFLQDLFFRNRRDRIIGEIVDRFETEKEALAYIFNCREDQISETEDEALSGKDVVLHCGYFDFHDITLLPEGIIFPRYIERFFSLNDVIEFPKKITLPERIGGDFSLRRLTHLPEGSIFPEHVGRNLSLYSLVAVPEGFSFPKRVDGSLYLPKLTVFPENAVLPGYVGGTLNLEKLTDLPEGFSFPEYIGGVLVLNKELKNHPAVNTVPAGVNIEWV